MKRPYQITAIVLLLLSAFFVHEALQMKIYVPLGPGPGFLPLWLGITLAALAMGILYGATFMSVEPMPSGFFPTRAGYHRLAGIMAALIMVVVLMDRIGFRLVMFLFYVFLVFVLGRQKLIVTVLVALVGSFGVYHVFVDWLNVQLPMGMFGF